MLQTRTPVVTPALVLALLAVAGVRAAHESPRVPEAAAAAGHQEARPPTQQQKPKPERPREAGLQYETRVDLLLVDVNVVDDKGKPVEGLSAEDFVVLVDNRPRRIVSAQFVQQQPARMKQERAPDTAVSTNRSPGAGRLFMILLDEASLSHAEVHGATRAISKFLDTLGPADRVGLVSIPYSGPQVDFTSNASLVREALKRVTGRRTSPILRRSLGLSEAIAVETGGFAYSEALQRECRGLTGLQLQACSTDVQSDARAMLSEIRHHAEVTLVSVQGVVRALGKVPGPKSLVLVSGGLVLADDDRSQLVAADAAAARTTIYALHFQQPPVDVAVARPSPTAFEDERLRRDGLERVAGRARGHAFSVAISADFAFERLAVETSGYYLLGLETADSDRDGKPHQIKVELVSRKDVTLRSRREFRVDPATATAPVEDRMADALNAPLPIADLPIRVATYVMAGKERGTVQVLVAAEVDEGQTSEVPSVVGFRISDATGRSRASRAERVTLKPLRADRPSPLYYMTAVALDPGDYVLRLAVAEREGPRGSIDHPVNARLNGEGPLQVGDLFVMEAVGRTAELKPEVETYVTGDRVAAFCDLGDQGSKTPPSASMTLEIATSRSGPALLAATGRPMRDRQGRSALQAVMSVALLPPGDYVARGIVTADGREVARLFRRFHLEPVEGAAAGADAKLLPVAVPIRAFRREDVLRPEVLAPFFDQLVEFGAPAGEHAQKALQEARAGRLSAVLDLPQDPNDLTLLFLRGLAHLERNELDTAAAHFRGAVRVSMDYLPALFYLGACMASAGKDTEAVGAWQTSLISEENNPIVYEVLADALLRLGRNQDATELLSEASERFPDNEMLPQRLALTAIAAGDRARGLSIIERRLERRPADLEALFLAIRLLYEAASKEDGSTRAATLTRLHDYARRYAQLNGPNQALVDRWLQALEKKQGHELPPPRGVGPSALGREEAAARRSSVERRRAGLGRESRVRGSWMRGQKGDRRVY